MTLALLAGGAVALAWGLTPARRAPTAAQPVVAPLAAAQPPAAALTPAAPVETQAQRAPPRLMVAHAEPARVPPASARPAPPRAAPAPQARHPDETPRGRDPIGERLAALSLAPATLAPEPTPAPPPASQAAPAIAPPPPAGGCADARTPARRMVCEDPELAAADRRMARAYRAAIAAGAPERQLRAEQQDWLDVREDAARRSPRAVASIYQQRIEDLQRWRDEAAARDPEPQLPRRRPAATPPPRSGPLRSGRRGLLAPARGRTAEFTAERAAEGGFGLVAHVEGDLRHGLARPAQAMPGKLHPPQRQVAHRRLADGGGELLGEGGPHVHLPRQGLGGPGRRDPGVHAAPAPVTRSGSRSPASQPVSCSAGRSCEVRPTVCTNNTSDTLASRVSAAPGWRSPSLACGIGEGCADPRRLAGRRIIDARS